MLLPREFVTYLSRQIVRRLSPDTLDVLAPDKVIELVNNLIADELDAEDKLNDEVREKLEEYSDYMRREGISYQEMFRKAKKRAGSAEEDCACVRPRYRRRDEAFAR